jgi:hydroxymethylpyrimidine/phosphomethylpyrimidine kinase
VTSRTQTPTALSIAGSDSGGGAGSQADLKAFARCGVHGTSAITAITAQNTVGVVAVHAVPAEIVLAQVRAVVADIGVDAVKVGMLGTVEVTLAVARALDELPPGTPVVVDPVMVAESGARLLQVDAQRVLVEEILPRATVLTPNLQEARVLAGMVAVGSEGAGSVAVGSVGVGSVAVGSEGAGSKGAESQGAESEAAAEDVVEDAGVAAAKEGGAAAAEDAAARDAEAEELARAVLALGPRIVVLTGGHRARAVDLFVDSEGDGAAVEIPGERHPDGAAHGSGCTHSAVLAAALALGRTPLEAARTARTLAGEAVGQGLRDVGAGAGPVDILGLGRRRSAIIDGR